MSKGGWSLILLFLILSLALIKEASFYASSANSMVTNWATLSYDTLNIQTNAVVTVGPIYGISVITSPSNHYYTPVNSTFRVPVAFTNNANDADSNAQISVQFLSNNAGYSGGAWSCYLEVNSSNVGSNYAIPFTDLGEGAVFNFNIVVQVPLVCPSGSIGFMSADVSTASNTGHIAAFYTGLNGLTYGGNSNSTGLFEVEAYTGNYIAAIQASDGVETITVFNGTRGLRRTAQTITVSMYGNPIDYNSLYLWYDIDNTADGPGGANPNDRSIKMNILSDKVFNAVVPESSVQTGSVLSFAFEIDGTVYSSNFTYTLLSVSSQGKYETILMHNLITSGSGENIYLKMPARVMGQNGKVLVYSVSGDLVMTLLNGRLDNQVINWDGNDKDNTQVAKGLYFIVVDFPDLKEVRKVFVK